MSAGRVCYLKGSPSALDPCMAVALAEWQYAATAALLIMLLSSLGLHLGPSGVHGTARQVANWSATESIGRDADHLVLLCNTSCCNEALIYIVCSRSRSGGRVPLVGAYRDGTASIPSCPDPVPCWHLGRVSRWQKRGKHLRHCPFVPSHLSARAPPVGLCSRPFYVPPGSEWLKGCAGDGGTHLLPASASQ
jgi:hypothetical protein